MARYIEEDEQGNRYIVDDGEEDPTFGLSRDAGAFAGLPGELGPNYEASLGANAIEGVTEAPRALMQMGRDVGSFASAPIQTIQNAGIEKTARTVGGLSSGTAGAIALGGPLAGWGTVLGGPLGGLAGGAIGGGVGFGAGLLGFDLATDVGTAVVENTADELSGGPRQGARWIRPLDQYAKDFAYNASQGAVTGGATEAAFLAARGLRAMPRSIADRTGFTKEGAGARVNAELEKLQPGYADQIDAATAAGASDPFLLNKSLGELIDSDVLKNSQRTIARTGPDAYGRQTELNAARNDAQLKWLDQIEKSPATIADVQASIQEGIANKLAASQRGVSQAEMGVSQAVGELPLPIDPLEAGSMMRESAAGAKDAMRGRITEKFEGAGTGVVDTSIPQSVIASEMPKYFREVGAQPNPELVTLIDQLSKTGEPTGLLDANGQPIIKPPVFTLQDTQAMRSKALAIAKSDKRSSAVANKLADALRDAEDAAVSSGSIAPEQVASLNAGRALRKEMGVDFESVATPTNTVLSKQPYGEYRVPESAVPSKYFRAGNKGTKEAIRNYKKVIGATEDALEPLYRYATDSFRDYVVKDGKVDATKARKWLDRHAASLDELPELRAQLSNVDNAQTFLNEKFGDLQRTQAEMERGALKQFLQVDPERAIEAMLSGRDMVKRTNSMVQYLKANDPDAIAGLRRGVIEHLKSKAFIPDGKVPLQEAVVPGGPQFDGTVRAGTLKQRWEQIKPALERSKLFTDSQMKGFDDLYKDVSSQLSVEKAKMPSGSDSGQNLSTMAYFVRAARNGFLKTILPGQSKYIAFAIEPILKQIPEARFQAALEEALLNPRYARDLASKATSKNVTRAAEFVFKDEFAKAFGRSAAMERTGSPTPLAAEQEAKPQPIPKQEQVLAKSSFPDPEDLLKPPTPGSLKKISFNVKEFIVQQPAETRARVSVESAGNPWATSRKGAQGLAQLMPATAMEIAESLGEEYMPLRPGMSPEEQRASIEQNIRFGDYYYKKQLAKYKDATLARAAYNAGPARVDAAIRLSGSSRDVNKVLSNLPKGVQKETIPYVQEIARRYGNV